MASHRAKPQPRYYAPMTCQCSSALGCYHHVRYHLDEEGCFSLDIVNDPSLPQLKTMLANLDPLGMPIATKVVSGETADDGLYIPFDQVRQTLQTLGLLSKMSS